MSFTFRSRPYVCGALGPASPAALARLRAGAPVEVREIARAANVHLWASHDLERWRHGHLWAPATSGPAPTSWPEAAENRMAAGLVLTPGTATLHTCALGLQELYTRRLGGAVYFATRIEPLLGLDDAPLHADEQAWASILCLGHPVGEATPFAEVRRMGPATAWQTVGGTVERRSFEPRYLHADAVPTPADLAALLTERLPRAPWFGRVHTTDPLLSGLLTRAGRRTRVWAAEDPGPASPAEINERIQYQTVLHPGLMPLARRLHRARGPVIDGLAGEVLLAPRPAASLWDVLSQGRARVPGMFAPAVTDHLERLAGAALHEATAHLRGHPAAATLATLLTRTVRGDATAPQLLYAPECRVHLPFADARVIRAALSVPEHRRDGYRREVLGAAAVTGTRPGVPSLAGMAEAVNRDEGVRRMLGPRMIAALENPDRLRSPASVLAMLQAVSMLAAWRARYAYRLASPQLTQSYA